MKYEIEQRAYKSYIVYRLRSIEIAIIFRMDAFRWHRNTAHQGMVRCGARREC